MTNNSKMCAVFEKVKWKPGKQQEAIDRANELQSEFTAIPGRKHYISVWNNDGTEYVLSIWDSPEAKEAAAEQVDALGEKFGDLFESFEAVDLENVQYFVGD